MKSLEFVSTEREDTIKLGAKLARLLKKGDVICLFGDLGSGKTTFTKGIAEGLKINPLKVNSPTFVLMNEYKGKLPLYHFDLYRIQTVGEAIGIGYEEFLYGDGISVVEWAEKLGNLIPSHAINIYFKAHNENERLIRFDFSGPRAQEIIAKLK